MLRLFVITLFLCPLFLSAQKSPTYLSVEGGGNGIIGSVNVGKPFIIHPRYKVILQWGIGWSPEKSQSNYPINFPTQIVCKIGKENFFLEAGVGSSLIFESTLDKAENERATNELYLSPILGFRHEQNSWFGRVYACPLFHVTGENLYDDLTSDFVKIGVAIGIIF